jgi:hypothetical protein
MPSPRFSATGAVAVMILVLTTSWLIVRHGQRPDIEASAPQDRSPDLPPLSPTARNNNEIMRLGMIPDLEGIAVLYSQEAESFIDAQGRFRVEVAGRFDPDATLFLVHAATLTANARARSVEMRKQHRREGERPGFVFQEWTVRKFAFTSRRLENPTAEERVILESIVRAKMAVMPRPGDGVRAIPFYRDELERGEVGFFPGHLPVVEPEDSP